MSIIGGGWVSLSGTDNTNSTSTNGGTTTRSHNANNNNLSGAIGRRFDKTNLNLEALLASTMNSGQQQSNQQQQGQGFPNNNSNMNGITGLNSNTNGGFNPNNFNCNSGAGNPGNMNMANSTPMNSTASSATGGAAQIANSDLQQALLQSMAASASSSNGVSRGGLAGGLGSGGVGGGGAHPSALFGSSHSRVSSMGSSGVGLGGVMNSIASSPSGLSSAQANLVQQVLNGMPNQQQQQGMQQQRQRQNQTNQGLHDQMQGQNPMQGQVQQLQSNLSQLVASIQAHQQAQQQAQVQAAIARAFGPNSTPNAGGSSSGGASLGLGNNDNKGGLSSGAAAAPSAHDLLSRIQLAQAGNTDNAANAINKNSISNPSNIPTVSTDVTKAGADDLIKLQLEQERHNRMIQMAQADRQERAMLANQEAMMKKHRRMFKSNGGGSVGGNGIGNIGTVAAMEEDVASLNGNVNGAMNSDLANIFSAAAAFNNPLLSTTNLSTILNPLLNPNTAGLPPSMLETDLSQKLGSARGAVIVPCRARGMPVDHNFKTAYFVIPEGIEHGDELMCSYPACRQAGVKFRYCLHCKVPVAKRNFRNRHRHGVPGGEGGSASEDDGEDEGVSSDEENVNNNDDSAAVNSENAGQDLAVASVAAAASAAPMCMPVDNNSETGKAIKQEHLIVIPSDNGMNKKKKKSGNTRVPCRARGMPMAHNFKTAYFIIPPNVQHGDELSCSFPACRSAGAKFRYCLHCKVPVAKRNFRNRHKHGNIGDKKKAAKNSDESNKEKKEEEENEEVNHNEDVDEEEASNSYDGRDRQDNDEDDGDVKPSSSPSVEGSTQPKTPLKEDPDEDAKPAASPSNVKRPQSTNSTDAKPTVSINSTHDADKVQAWVSLLESKPDPSDKQAMAIWMLNLMNATENAGSGPAAAAPSPAAASQQNSEQLALKRASSKESEGSSQSRPPKKKFKHEYEDL